MERVSFAVASRSAGSLYKQTNKHSALPYWSDPHVGRIPDLNRRQGCTDVFDLKLLGGIADACSP